MSALKIDAECGKHAVVLAPLRLVAPVSPGSGVYEHMSVVGQSLELNCKSVCVYTQDGEIGRRLTGSAPGEKESPSQHHA